MPHSTGGGGSFGGSFFGGGSFGGIGSSRNNNTVHYYTQYRPGAHVWVIYLHALAVDGTGNTSDVATYKIGYTIEFDANGGTGSMDGQNILGNNKLQKNAFSKIGYTFTGWSDTQTDYVKYKDEQSLEYNQNLVENHDFTSTAIEGTCKKISDGVYQYERKAGGRWGGIYIPGSQIPTNGHKFTLSYQVKHISGADLLNQQGHNHQTTQHKFTIDGKDAGYQYSSSSNSPYYLNDGKWHSISVTLSRSPDQVAASTDPNIYIQPNRGDDTAIIVQYRNIKLETFDSETIYMNPASRSTMLYAVWQPNTYTVKFDTNGGTGSMPDEMMSYDTAKALTANAFTRKGYTFIGWNTKADGTGTTYTDGQSVINMTDVSNDVITLYAQWKSHTITITFDINGGISESDGFPDVYTYSYGNTLEAMSFPDPNHYTKNKHGYHINFYYHVGSPDGMLIHSDAYGNKTVQYMAQEIGFPIESKDQKVTFYVHWVANSYTIKFDANGVKGSMPDETMAYDTAKTLTANAFSRKGYTFTGWNTKADGTGTSYTDKQSVSNLTSDNNGTVTLYAMWRANTYIVSIPTAINYKNMSIGIVDTSDEYNVTVSCKDGDTFNNVIKISSQPSSVASESEESKEMSVSTNSGKTPLMFKAAGSQKDCAKISGKINTLDIWKGRIQYTVSIE